MSSFWFYERLCLRAIRQSDGEGTWHTVLVSVWARMGICSHSLLCTQHTHTHKSKISSFLLLAVQTLSIQNIIKTNSSLYKHCSHLKKYWRTSSVWAQAWVEAGAQWEVMLAAKTWGLEFNPQARVKAGHADTYLISSMKESETSNVWGSLASVQAKWGILSQKLR